MDPPVLLAARLPHLLLAEAVVGARAHGRGDGAADGHRRARHALVLPRVVRDARSPGRALRAEAHPARDPDHRRAASCRGPESLGARSRPLLSHPQGRATRERARAVRRLDLGDSARSVAESRRHAEGAVVGALRRVQDPPARRLGREAGLVVHQRQRDTLQPSARRRVPLHRLHSVHAPDDSARGGACRSLGRIGQAGVRHSLRTQLDTTLERTS